MEWIDFDRRGIAKAAHALEQMLQHAPPAVAPRKAPSRLPPPSRERLQQALDRCARALSEAAITGAAPVS